jgi:hypothetical protein
MVWLAKFITRCGVGRLLPLLLLAHMSAGCVPRAEAQPSKTPVDLELVLAVDISLSMDLDELRLQRDGYVAALRDPELLRVIARGRHRRIAVTYFEWAGPHVQILLAPWTLIDGPETADRLAGAIERAPISRERLTSIAAALGYAGRLFEQSPFSGIRRVVDVSGDGPNNSGRHVTAERDALVAAGITINGLPIVLKTTGSAFDMRDLDIYYEDCVIGGTDAFVISVRGVDELQPAIRRKLLQEVAATARPAGGFIRVQATGGATDQRPTTRIDCTIGEQLWRRYMEGR